MTHRDRAWRRRVTRVLTHREEEAREQLAHHKEEATTPHLDAKTHRPGKLTPAQAMRQNWQLNEDARDGWSGDAPIHAPPPGP